jgi:hypothetical protein
MRTVTMEESREGEGMEAAAGLLVHVEANTGDPEASGRVNENAKNIKLGLCTLPTRVGASC